ncbi:fungal-specific transcription factor domain-containing protein [Hysterangium stoloniferum]|nr:fungal-specific transcription factor domain-containing protein [Hysterangium stoloniferum]
MLDRKYTSPHSSPDTLAQENTMPVRNSRFFHPKSPKSNLTTHSRRQGRVLDLSSSEKGAPFSPFYIAYIVLTDLQKCDEQREDNSCSTCRRLKIECLGWGVRRPDKARVEAYKAAIKRQLSSQGMIRGQPRPPAPINASPVQYQYPDTHFTHPAQDNNNSDETDEYAYDRRSVSANTSPAIQMPHLTPDLSYGISALDLQLFPTPGAPSAPLPQTFANTSPHVIPGDLSMLQFMPTQAYYDLNPVPASVSPTSAPNPEIRNQYIKYFFRRVRHIQFLFSGQNVESLFRDLVVREPSGVVATAICALAALHQSQVRVAEGLEDPHAENSRNSVSKQFYEEAIWQLQTSRQRYGRYNEQDATAAIHLVSYKLIEGGKWLDALNIAFEWLQDGPLNTAPNPQLQWLQLSLTARFTTQMTMWLDIISATNTSTSPRFMDLYRRLFRADQNSWPGSAHDAQVPNLHMVTLTGCPDPVMYAIAETALLSDWKRQHQQNGILSIKELVRRADSIENDLRRSWAPSEPEVFPHLLDFHYDMNAPSSSPHPSPMNPTTDLASSAGLSTPSVINDQHPGVPEIKEGVIATVQALHKLETLEPDRGLVFPICLAGCLTDVREQREFFRRCLDSQRTSLGNRSQTLSLMESVWRKRDAEGGVVDWRAIMPDLLVI